MKHVYTPKGVCSRQMEVETEGNKIKEVKIIGGCAGNSLGVSSLVKDMDIDEAIRRLKGIPCGFRSTSCPDQLSIALEEIKEKQKDKK